MSRNVSKEIVGKCVCIIDSSFRTKDGSFEIVFKNKKTKITTSEFEFDMTELDLDVAYRTIKGTKGITRLLLVKITKYGKHT